MIPKYFLGDEQIRILKERLEETEKAMHTIVSHMAAITSQIPLENPPTMMTTAANTINEINDTTTPKANNIDLDHQIRYNLEDPKNPEDNPDPDEVISNEDIEDEDDDIENLEDPENNPDYPVDNPNYPEDNPDHPEDNPEYPDPVEDMDAKIEDSEADNSEEIDSQSEDSDENDDIDSITNNTKNDQQRLHSNIEDDNNVETLDSNLSTSSIANNS